MQTGKDRLDEMIAALDFEGLESALGGFLSVLRNDGAIHGVDRNQTWVTALAFVSDIVSHLALSAEDQLADVQAKLLRLERLYGQISLSKPRPPAPIRALPAVVVEELYQLFDPASPDNPFRTPALRWRNFLIFLLLLHLGLRRGEVALLPADAVKDDFNPATGEVRCWLNVDETPYEDEEDPRYDAPGLKTAHSRRQVPVSEQVVKVFDTVVQDHRRGVTHSYLMWSQWRKPLALRSLHRVFETVTAQLSPLAQKALADQGKDGVSAHDLRHTSAVYRLSRYVAQGDDLDTAIEKLRVFFGWSESSPMPRHYARAYFETRLVEVWNDGYDTFVAMLRSLEGSAQ
jgi:integrase